ncbi:MAG TPA: beta-ketoacyl-[acyl-carrier-protein] synthase family protein [Pirellulaceae bacterium]|nr:beta-ketoacyl-[acyl-carrier-protein] synthase family protein [Pirellulaceae bacterium]
MPAPRDVVITGVGVVCPIGIGREPFWQALDEGISGIDLLPEFAGADLPFRSGGLIKTFDAKEYVQPRKTLKVMCPEIQAAFAASVLAMQDAGLAKGAVDPDRLGVVLGSEMLYGDLLEMSDAYRHSVAEGQFAAGDWATHAMRDLFPLWMLKYLPNMAACHIGIANDARGPNNSIIQGGVSSLLAMIEASYVLLRGHGDVMIAGGSGAAVSTSALTFRGWSHLSKSKGPPSQSPRPLDARRDGTVLGEGSACLVLETREHADRRGAKTLARVAGFASRFEQPPIRGGAIGSAITAALRQANIAPGNVGHVNAHAGGSVELDAVEARAIRETLGNVPVTAPKSFFGDLGAGSGAVELIASVLALAEGRVPRTLNYEQADPRCPVNVVRGASLTSDKPAAVAINLSDRGHAVAMVLVRE